MSQCAVCLKPLRKGARPTPRGWVHAKCERLAYAYGAPTYGYAHAPPARRDQGARRVGMLAVVALMIAATFIGLVTAVAAPSTTSSSIHRERESDPSPTAIAAEQGARVEAAVPAWAPRPLAKTRPTGTTTAQGRATPTTTSPAIRTPAPTPSPAPKTGSGRLRCGDGTLSPSCSCGGSHRGCCSRYGGVAGCDE